MCGGVTDDGKVMFVGLLTVVQDSSWIMVAPVQGPEGVGAAGLAVAVQPDRLHLNPTKR